MEVKVNKTNGQKYVSIPKNSSLKEGNRVNITLKNILSEKELSEWYAKNKESIDNMHKELVEYSSNFILSPESMFADYLEKKFNLEIECDEGVDITCGEVWVSTDGYYDEAYDCDNYFNPSDFDGEDTNVFKEGNHQDVGEYYSFDEKYFDEKYENFNNSMKVFTYMTIMNKLKKEYDTVINRILNECEFELLGWGGNLSSYESVDIYKHKAEDIYLQIPLGYECKDEIILCNQESCYGDDGEDHKEVVINLSKK